VGSVPEKQRSLTPELQERKASFRGGMDSEACKTSPVKCLPDDAAEEFTAPSLSPPQALAANQQNMLSNHTIEPAVISSRSECDGIHAPESLSHCPDPYTASSQIPSAHNQAHTTESSHSRKKKRKRRSPVADDNSNDVRQTDVKESHKHKRKDHKHKDRSHAANEVDETRKLDDIASKVSGKDSIDATSHSDHEAKQKKTADDLRHKADDVVNLESVNNKRSKTRESEENSDNEAKQKKTADDSKHKADDVVNLESMNHKRSKTRESEENSDNEAKQKKTADDSKHKADDVVNSESVNRKRSKKRESEENSDNEAKQKKTADDSRHKADDVVNSESVNRKRSKTRETEENFTSRSFGDECRAKAGISGSSSTAVVRQYRHQDSIRERTSIRTNISRRRRRERTSVSAALNRERTCACRKLL